MMKMLKNSAIFVLPKCQFILNENYHFMHQIKEPTRRPTVGCLYKNSDKASEPSDKANENSNMTSEPSDCLLKFLAKHPNLLMRQMETQT